MAEDISALEHFMRGRAEYIPSTRTSNPGFSLPAAWEFEVIKEEPKAILVKSPFGRLAVVTSFSRHPENILFELASEIINQQTKE